MIELARESQRLGIAEESDLKAGMDFRLPQYRREVFLRFYEFHLRYKSHPGAVYYVMPYMAQRFNWTMEQKLWYAFINGATQNPLTSWVVFSHFPELEKIDIDKVRIELPTGAPVPRIDPMKGFAVPKAEEPTKGEEPAKGGEETKEETLDPMQEIQRQLRESQKK